jgi:hypothetical protein
MVSSELMLTFSPKISAGDRNKKRMGQAIIKKNSSRNNVAMVIIIPLSMEIPWDLRKIAINPEPPMVVGVAAEANSHNKSALIADFHFNFSGRHIMRKRHAKDKSRPIIKK